MLAVHTPLPKDTNLKLTFIMARKANDDIEESHPI